MSFPRLVLLFQSLLAGALIVVGASNLSEAMSPTATAVLILVVTAMQAAVAVLSHVRGFTVAVAGQVALAVGQAVVASGSLTGLVPHTAAVWIALVVAAAQAAAAAWAAGVATPTPLSVRQFLR